MLGSCSAELLAGHVQTPPPVLAFLRTPVTSSASSSSCLPAYLALVMCHLPAGCGCQRGSCTAASPAQSRRQGRELSQACHAGVSRAVEEVPVPGTAAGGVCGAIGSSGSSSFIGGVSFGRHTNQQ